ncbi:LysM peptidoglycan-binding domain-containing protein [Streptomyces sp. NA02950]|uniref:LysM peptidoglycan-binding domain-containing protein n=1 Tax=Streptomyces sp. NA02950 TaxID=2742137 RepID=UPI001591C3E0|nr:LysM peptidoglycan-binding domain-containing protein [Streptomyces sp. NA02950]QKV90411.1 LysM peptidoglycan-binding domain-containing protein [Streptomyces sp. NA02950]QKV97256.1 LysM peptidoglycan-binding domain-containing protein [Streptomyces sp. NA02950]
MPPPPLPTKPRHAVLRGLAALLLLAATIAGLPVLLAVVTTALWHSGHDDLTHLLDRQDTGGAFLLALVAIAWIAWAHFTFCVLAEIPAQLRGRAPRPSRRINVSRHAAAALISSVLVLLPTGTALATPSPAAAAPTAESTPGTAKTHHDQAPSPTATTERGKGQHTYTVQDTRPAESLWSIAEKQLGDGERWKEIAALNQGRTMTDGSRFDADSFIQPGWKLLMPGSPGSGSGDPHQGGSGRTVTVAPGDTLSTIAEEQLGDPERYDEIFDRNKGHAGPDGRPLTDPDQIHPGQQLLLPSPTAPHDRDTRPGTDTERRQSGDHENNHDSTSPSPRKPDHDTRRPDASPRPQNPRHHHDRSREHTPGSKDGRRGEETTRPPATPAPTQQHTDTSHRSTPEPAAHSEGVSVRTTAGVGALLAAVLVGGIGLRRLIQQRRRKPGETIAMPEESSRLEQTLTASAAPASAELLDTALRTLAHQAAQAESTLPVVRGARVTARTVELLPDTPGEPMPPFAAGTGDWWALDAQAELLEPERARQVQAPYPGLATLGTDAEGTLYLANLPQLSTLLIQGDQPQVDAVCTAIALETGMSPWADQADILLIGFGRELPRLLPTSRARHLPHAAAAIRDLGERLLEAHQDPELGAQLPWMLICASRISEEEAWQLADALDKARGLKVAAVLPESGIGHLFPNAEQLNAGTDEEAQELEVLGARIQVQSVSSTAYEQLVATLEVTEQPSRPADGAWEKVPPEPPTPRPIPAQGGEALEDAGPGNDEQAPEGPFPALIGAASDPAGLRLLSPSAPSPRLPQDSDDIADPVECPAAERTDVEAAKPELTDAAADPGSSTDRNAGDSPAPGSPTDDAPEVPTARDLHAPEVRVLGPLEVTGVGASGHGPKLTELAVLLYFRPHRDTAGICEAMDPANPWSTSTLNSRMYGLRNKLGVDADGNPYVPRRTRGTDSYRLAPAVRCDWTIFQQLAERGLTAASPTTAAGYLEQALSLVRGRPLGGRDLPWAAPLQQEMISRIIDVAHTLATYRSDPTHGELDLEAARRAIAVGIDVEPTAELLYRDWMRIEHAAGNRGGLHTAITTLQQAIRTLDLDLEPETEQLISLLLINTPSTNAV